MKFKTLILAATVLFGSNIYAKDKLESLSQINYDSSLVNKWVDNQETTFREIGNAMGAGKSIFINYGYAVAHHRGKSETLLVSEHKNSLQIDSVTGDVVLRRKGLATKIIGKINGSVDDKSGTIQLEKSIKAQFPFVKSIWSRECTAKLIDVCIARGVPKKIKIYKFDLLENGNKIFSSDEN